MFTNEEPQWTIEAAAAHLTISIPTAYRYFSSLARVGLISPVSRATYVLGPRIIELDRQIRISDPFLRAARRVTEDLIQYAAEGSAILVCRLFRDRVICIHQEVGRGPQGPVSFERGRPMPLFRGATSKVILAHLPARALRSIYLAHSDEIRSAGLGEDWESFRNALAKIRRSGMCMTNAEVDPGRVGISAPVFDAEHLVIGSLTFVLPAYRADETLQGRLIPLTVAGAREIERAMAGYQFEEREPPIRAAL